MCFLFRKKNNYEINCPICLENLNKTKYVVALNCGHLICFNCTKSYVPNLKYPSKYLNMENVYSELSFKLISCPLCRSIEFGNFIYFDKINCEYCSIYYTHSIQKNIKFFHLNCGHLYCSKCIKKFSEKNCFGCVTCYNYNKIFPLYLTV